MMKRQLWAVFALFFASCGGANTAGPSYGKNLDGFAYPFEVKRFRFVSQQQEMQMAYMDEGNKTSAEVVVLLHGKNFSGYYWERVATDLVKKGYRVIIPDQVGFGKSTKPAAYQYSFAQLAFNTSKLVESLGIKEYTAVGHSMGGMLATHLAATYPQVIRLVLINPIGLEDYLQYVVFKDPQFFYEAELAKTVDKARGYQQKNYYDGNWKSEYETLLLPFKGWNNGPDREIICWNNALTYGPIFSEEIVSTLKNIKKETHLIVGTRDRTAPGRGWMKKGIHRDMGRYDQIGKQIAAANDTIVLHELEGLGHMPFHEDYAAFSTPFFSVFKK